MKKVGGIIVGFLIVIGAVLLREIVAVGCVIAYMLLQWMTGNLLLDRVQDDILSFIENMENLLLVSAMGTLVWIVLFGFIYWSSRRKIGKKLFEGSTSGKQIVILFVMGLGLQFLINSILGIIMQVAPAIMERYQQVIDSLGMGNSLISLVYIVLIGPIGEELVFRGVVFSHMKKHVSFFTANLFQAAFFGIYHMNLIQGLYAFALGLLLGYITERSGSIKESVLLHMAINLSGCLVGFLVPAFLFETLWGLILLFAISVCLLVFSFKTVKIERDTVG